MCYNIVVMAESPAGNGTTSTGYRTERVDSVTFGGEQVSAVSSPDRLAFRRQTIWHPAWSKRNPDPNRDYGVHGVELLWVLSGPAGAITWAVFTNWMLSDLEMIAGSMFLRRKEHADTTCPPMGATVGFHSPCPWPKDQLLPGFGGSMQLLTALSGGDPYELNTQQPDSEHCEWLGGRPCYADRSGLESNGILALLLSEGGEAVWARLERLYWEHFRVGHALLDGCLWLDQQLAARMRSNG